MSAIVWIYGLPGSGHEQVAAETEATLRKRGVHCATLVLPEEAELAGESPSERLIPESLIAAGQCSVVLSCSLSAYRKQREEALLAAISDGHVYVDALLRTPLEQVVEELPDGAVARALDGEAREVPGVAFAFEYPLNPEIVLESGDAAARASQIVAWLSERSLIPQAAESVLADVPDDVFVGVLSLSEALMRPELLGTWGEAFDASDRALLVLYAPDTSAEEAIGQLAPVIAAQGLAEDGSAELTLLAGRRSSATDNELNARAQVLLGQDAAGLDLSSQQPDVAALRVLYEEARNV